MVQKRQRVVIAGGGTAGWVAAATLSSQIGAMLDITLVESDRIGTVGVGEATIPTHKTFHRLLGIDEQEFMRETRASFKLGISFEDWGQVGDRYIHSFGTIGPSTWMGDFQHMWYQAKADGYGGELDEYCLELQAAKAGKFSKSDAANLNYAYHLDSSLYSKFLRKFSEARDVKRVEGTIENVRVNDETGFIDGLDLQGGQQIDGDFFIDCTGFRALLIGKAMGVTYEDWSHWLPMNRAIAVQTKHEEDILPYTRTTARKAGWQWRIPLQHRIGNGHVYCSDYMSDDEAYSILIDNIQGEKISEPKPIKFLTGKRKKAWNKNCLALGLSSGFLEPLESTSIHLIQIGATRLVQMFPFSGVSEALSNHYNKSVEAELDSIKDFLIVHYKLNRRTDPFWKDMAAMNIPETLKHRIDLFKNTAITHQTDLDLFRTDSWVQVMRGQGLESQGHHHVGRLLPEGQLKAALSNRKSDIQKLVGSMPKHADFVRDYCRMDVE